MRRREFISGASAATSTFAIGSGPERPDLRTKLLEFTEMITSTMMVGLAPKRAEKLLEDMAGKWGFHVATVEIFPERDRHVVALGIIKNDGDEGIVYRWEVPDFLSGFSQTRS